jgi:hypothetical protein
MLRRMDASSEGGHGPEIDGWMVGWMDGIIVSTE